MHYVDQQCYVLCFREIETASHLLPSCPKTRTNMRAYIWWCWSGPYSFLLLRVRLFYGYTIYS
ncbi:hypothetical protein MtrunA17_Chr5g0407401 [Medicago truncatula]|uniref:Uncharacterized protein n=1 Tax=Medicago truncatula TaxID=3880 RepID=A0A396HUV8_MEDTR|nr:hypothetical protein MtrunA17_Chr5g0407401 [Medicago truncatula]